MAWVSDMGADFTPDGKQYQLFSILTWLLEEPEARLTALANIPMAGQARDDVLAGYRCKLEGGHLVFYRGEAEGSVLIVRVLHKRRLPGRIAG